MKHIQLGNLSANELIKIRDNYVGKYIGDYDKPINYHNELKRIDKLISLKS